MASYFDEHECDSNEQRQNHARNNGHHTSGERSTENLLLRIARLLAENASRGSGGNGEFDGLLFDFGEMLNRHPPASKAAIQSLPTHSFTHQDEQADKEESSCPVCLAKFKEGDQVISMPCEHRFHNTCILPWLEKAEEKEREQRVEELHDSMFS